MHSLIVFAFLILFSSTAFDVIAKQRPKVGLVLSGGGAKGAAHIGVLKVLEQHNVPIDYVVGTSIGAYVAGLYALGYTPSEIEKIMLGLPWENSFTDSVPRQSLPFREQALRDKYNIVLRLGYSDKTFKAPTGLLLGQNSTQLLRLSTDVIAEFSSFDQLAIPYRAVATDLSTAKAVVLDSGSITEAMSASAAVPSIVEPVVINGKMLVDGGISNNMPVDVIRKMGADRIIAVDIGSPLADQDHIKDTVDVLNQLSTILTNNTTLQQVAQLRDNDLYIRPKIDGLSTTDFSIMPQALTLGEEAARAEANNLASFSVNDEQYASYLQQKSLKSQSWFQAKAQPIVAIDYENYSTVHEAIIAEYFAINVGDVVTKEQLKQAIDRVYALNRFERVNAEFIDTEYGRKLLLILHEKSWGPDFLHFGFSLQTDFSENTVIAIDTAYIKNDVTENGGQWKNELSLGWETRLATEFYQPLGLDQVLYSRTGIEYTQDKWAQSYQRTEVTNSYVLAQSGLGYNYSNQGFIELGLLVEPGDMSFEDKILEDIKYFTYGGYLSFGYDNLNSINFPTSGNKFSLDFFFTKDRYKQELIEDTSDHALVVNFDWRGAFGFNNHTFLGIASIVTVENDIDFSMHVTSLGGFLNLSGFEKDSLIGNHKAFAAIAYQYDLGRKVPGGTDLPIYIGTSLEAGNVWGGLGSIELNDLITSGSVYLGTDTRFGPAVIGLGYASEGESTIFISFGKNW